MNARIFVSHYSRDAAITEIIASLISRISLQQIQFWCSSDISSAGGIAPGRIWIEEIKEKLSVCSAVVAVLTPVCVGLSAADAPFPLGLYQCFELIDKQSLLRFCEKLLSLYSIPFDEELTSPLLEQAISKLVAATPIESDSGQDQATWRSILRVTDELKQHVDRRFLDILEATQLAGTKPPQNKGYSVSIKINFQDLCTEQVVSIDYQKSVQNVLDSIYLMLSGRVRPHTYLEKWVLREISTKRRLIIREIQSLIPARFLFTPELQWEAIELSKPYSGSEEIKRGSAAE